MLPKNGQMGLHVWDAGLIHSEFYLHLAVPLVYFTAAQIHTSIHTFVIIFATPLVQPYLCL